MPVIKSLDELKRIREEAIEKRKLKTSEGKIHITVAMGTCGIAAGARDTMKAILDTIEKDSLQDVIVTQTGCIGLCEREPIIMVEVGDTPKVTYGKVNADVAKNIMKEHIEGGKVVQNHVIPM